VVVLVVFADAGEVGDDGDVELGENILGAETGAFED